MTKYFIFITIMLLSLTACEKFDFMNLKRDNPLDEKNDANKGNDANKKGGYAIKFNDFHVYSDNNGDKIINKGETVKLNVALKNNGTSDAKGVKVKFSTTSQYLSGFSPTSQTEYGYIMAGSIKWYNDSPYSDWVIQFTVSNTTPDNTQIPINIAIEDESGNTWTSSFNITVSATGANITYNDFHVYSDNNGDKIINKGETIKLNVALKNDGTSNAKGVKATFSTTSQYLSSFSPTSPIYYGYIMAGSIKWYNDSPYSDWIIQFTVSNTTPDNTQIPIYIAIEDECNNRWNRSFYITVQ